jgi:enediyne biosynthesis protein E4
MNRRTFLDGVVGAGVAFAAQRMVSGQELSKAVTFPVKFENVAAHAGLTAPTIYGGRTTWKYILETTGCGVAFFDYDNDGWLDIFLVNGTTLEGTESPRPTNRLYHNNRDGTFTDVTERAGLVKSGWGQGVCVGDYDNDGFDDLFVTYWGHNLLYHNNGDGTFTGVTKKSDLDVAEVRWGVGCAFLDYDRDGFLDLFVANYIDFDLKTAPLPNPGASNCLYRGMAVNCGPKGLVKARNHLYRNNGDGTFTDVSEKSGIAKAPPSFGLGVLVGDFNNDSFPDIYVANDSEPAYLFWNNRDGTFTEGAMLAGVGTSGDGRNQSGMGVAAGDYNCDGLLDILKTNFSDDLPNLYRNDGGGLFEEETLAAGLGLHLDYLGWGCGFPDVDNDGWPDIFWVNGHVYPEIDRLKGASGFRLPMVLYRNLGNSKFEDVTSRAGPAFGQKLVGRGAAFGDFDNDGNIDIVVNPINDLPLLLKCESASQNNWITLKLIGTKSNRSAIGTRVRCVTGKHQQIDEVRSGGSFMSQSDLRVHFGLGKAGQVDLLEVSWPSGRVDHFTKVAVNKIMTLHEGEKL